MGRISESSQGRGGGPDRRPNSLGLDGKQLEALLARIDGRAGGKADRRRKFVRWAFRRTTLDLEIMHPGGSAITCRVACRNLSCGGISVVHSAFLYPGSACVVSLPRANGAASAVPGVITRCLHIQGMVHEVGIKFDSPITAADYMAHDPMSGQFSLETVDAEALAGTVLHLEHSPLEQRLIQHYLRGSALRLRAAHTIEAAMAITREGCDIVLCSYQLTEPGAEAVLQSVRGLVPDVPVVVTTTDSSPGTLERIRALRVSAFLPKPYDDAVLRRALGEFLLIRRKAAPAGVRAPAEPAGDWAAEVAAFPAKLEAAMACKDAAACYVVCEQVTTLARARGLPALERLAQRASAALSSNMSIPKSEREVRELIAACGRRNAA